MKPSTAWTKEEAKSIETQSSLRLMELLLQLLPTNKIVIDFGCGPGFYVKYLQDKGYMAFGIEGTPKHDGDQTESIIRKDLSLPLDYLPMHNTISFEVGEHIYSECESIFLDNITKNVESKVVMSWAIPGQGGHGHINEKDNVYIINEMEKRGFKLNLEETLMLRNEIRKQQYFWWFRNTLMSFDKK
jgi:hypothetical protein